ncbi:AMP-binding protein [uncultured Jatrophihabitans sp.]|uniref:AMP-binding protein n=1 Tax=uncultured Jatrophihabitans sp. TaxID=1610747 RepID=UPI0035CA8226
MTDATGHSAETGSAVVRYAQRVQHTARNVAEFVRFGGLDTGEEQSPFTVEAEQQNYRLRHYFADDVPPGATPLLMIPPLMVTTEVWDVSPNTTAVGSLHAEGLDTWVVDFGHPDREPGGLERTLTDHVLAVSDAIDRVVKATDRPVVLAGYSQGGMFAYQAAAYRRGRDIDSLVTFGSPVDTRAPLPIPISPDVVSRLANDIVESGLLRKIAVPGWFSRSAFKMLTPAKSLQDRVQFLLALTDRDSLLPRERQRRFLDGDGWTAYSGPAIAELLEQFVTHNRMLEGGFVIDDRLVTLADIELPVLTFLGSRDTIGHPDSVRAIRRAAPRATVYEVSLPVGHFGLVVGSTANERTWPDVSSWVRWRQEQAPLPDEIVLADTVTPGRGPRPDASMAAVGQAIELGVGAGRIAVQQGKRVTRLVRGIVRDAPQQLPRLSRIEQLEPHTQISLGLLLDEQTRRAPEDISFLFGDRAYRQHDLKRRVDNVVRGLIDIGVRHGDRVGVLMATRPSAFTVIAAVSRLGATAVLLRPDGDTKREIALGRVGRVISDPEHLDPLDELADVEWAVLGGGGEGRKLHPRALDMERIDPDQVPLPGWFSPNPHKATDVAFVLFTGEGAGTKALQITNRRWALSALGTASAASLRPGDTVFSTTPIHHSSALLMSIGGAVASGARFALASHDDPDTFWEEVRRYGATHVAYTWTSLHDIVDAPPNPAEQHHPIRMFIGSGMPRNLGRRVAERFPTTKIVEFYASAEGEAILANVKGRTAGSMGKPLPGTAEVRVASFDLATKRLRLGSDGLARECLVDEIGLLLARVHSAESSAGTPMRGVFESGDAWQSSGDLFLRDGQGDLWLAGSLSEIVDTAHGPALPSAARYALATVPAVDLIVAYGVPEGDDDDVRDVVVVAVTVRSGAQLTSADLEQPLGKLPLVHRPRYVQVVPSIPMTTWHRPLWRTLQAKGVPTPSRTRQVWRLDDDGTHYRPLD